MDGDDLGGLVEQQAPLGLRVVATRLAEVLVLATDALHRGKLADGPRQRLQLRFGVRRDWRREGERAREEEEERGGRDLCCLVDDKLRDTFCNKTPAESRKTLFMCKCGCVDLHTHSVLYTLTRLLVHLP